MILKLCDRIEALTAERDALAAILKGAEYRIEPGFLEMHGVEGGLALGQEAANATKQIIAERDELADKLKLTTRMLDQCTLATIYVSGRYIDRHELVVDCRSTLAAIQEKTDD